MKVHEKLGRRRPESVRRHEVHGTIRRRLRVLQVLMAMPILIAVPTKSLDAGDLAGDILRHTSQDSMGSQGWPLQFDSEVIRLFVLADSVEVDGIYRFLCRPSSVKNVALRYPYPEDNRMGGARMVTLERRSPGAAWQTLEFEELPEWGGARWRIPLSPERPVLEVRAVYRQALFARYARYIVTTTRVWEKPLRRARFEVYLPEGVQLAESSYPFEERDSDGSTFYLYEAENFWPQEDITIEWTP